MHIDCFAIVLGSPIRETRVRLSVTPLRSSRGEQLETASQKLIGDSEINRDVESPSLVVHSQFYVSFIGMFANEESHFMG